MPSSLPSRGGAITPARALLHPVFLAAVAILALNDHAWKGSHLLPGVVTGKLSDFAGLFVAPIVLAALLRVRTVRGLVLADLVTGVVFAAIKVSPAASHAFEAALGAVGITWKNWCDPTDLVALPTLLASSFVLLPWMRRERSTWLALLEPIAVAAALPVIAGSGDANIGGANSGGHDAGSGKTGVDLAVGDIAIDPTGSYFLSRKDGALLHGDLASQRIRTIGGVEAPDRVAFFAATRGEGFYALSGTASGYEHLVAFDLGKNAASWNTDLARDDSRIGVDPHGHRVVLSNASDLAVLDPDTGAVVGTFAPDSGIADVALLPDGTSMVVTGNTRFDSTGNVAGTTIWVRSLADASAVCQLDVANCADELVLAPDGKRAFLAPTKCQKDPISVVDTTSCTLVKQLPGFGPVALSQNGTTAVGFLDRDQTDPLAPPLPDDVKNSTSRYHLMFVDTTSLEYGTLAIGESLPRYAVTPDGKLLLVDEYAADEPVRILDVADRSLKTVSGPQVSLANFVLTPDSRYAFALQAGLYRVDTVQAAATKVLVGFAPSAINIVPSGDTLLLKDGDGAVHLFDVGSDTVLATMQADATIAPLRKIGFSSQGARCGTSRLSPSFAVA